MKLIKVLSCVLCACIALGSLSGCTNNLTNNWEDYTGDTDVYYNTTTTTVPTEKGEELDAYQIPRYWNDELKAAVEETEEAVHGAKGDYTSFLWYNDAHWSYSAQRSVSLLKYLQDYTGVNFVNFGGDIVSDNSAVEYDEIVRTLEEWREATLELSNHYSVVGNHDDDIAKFENRDDLYEFLLSKETGKVFNVNNKFCYYVDNEAQKTRYVYWDTGFETITSNDLKFLVDTLNSTNDGWHIVMVSHIWFLYNDTSTPTEGRIPDYVKPIFSIIDAYNARSVGSIYLNEYVNYDFSSAGAKVEFCIGGHTHVDFEFRTDGGIPVILNETDSYHLRGGDKTIESSDEAAVSVIVADYDKQIINIIRAGRGESRTVNLAA